MYTKLGVSDFFKLAANQEITCADCDLHFFGEQLERSSSLAHALCRGNFVCAWKNLVHGRGKAEGREAEARGREKEKNLAGTPQNFGICVDPCTKKIWIHISFERGLPLPRRTRTYCTASRTPNPGPPTRVRCRKKNTTEYFKTNPRLEKPHEIPRLKKKLR